MLKDLQSENAWLREALTAERQAHAKTKKALKEAIEEKQTILSAFRQKTTMYRYNGRSPYSGVSFEALAHTQYARDRLDLCSSHGRRYLGYC